MTSMSRGWKALGLVALMGCDPALAAPQAATKPVTSIVEPTQLLSPVQPYKAPVRNEVTTRALKQFDDSRFAMFIHWGLYAEAGGIMRGERIYGLSEWVMQTSHTPSAEYLKLAHGFNPVDFDAKRWVELMKAAGVRYFVITAKHHDGFAMFKSAASKNNIVDATPFGRDPLKELADAAHAAGIGVGFYYSQYQDWTEPNGAGNNWEFDPKRADFDEYFHRKVVPQVTELLTNYGPVREIWFDTPGPMPERYSRELHDLVKRLQPSCLLNSRIGNGLGDYASPNDSEVAPAALAPDAWEAIFTHNHSWGYSKFDNDFKPTSELIHLLVTSASRGGNFMLNEGPDARGRIPEDAEKRLLATGDWIKRNGESIYGTTRSPLPQMPWGVATQRDKRLYLHVFDKPTDDMLRVPGLTERVTRVTLLDGGQTLSFTQTDGGLEIALPKGLAIGDARVVAVDTAVPVAPQTDRGAAISPAYGRQTFDIADATMGPGVTLNSVRAWLAVDDDRKFYTATGLTQPDRSVAWTVQVERAGDYHVDLQYAATPEQTHREGVLEIEGQSLPFTILQSGEVHRMTFGTMANRQLAPLAFAPIGLLHFPRPGTYTIRLHPATAGGELFMLRTMYLSPAN